MVCLGPHASYISIELHGQSQWHKAFSNYTCWKIGKKIIKTLNYELPYQFFFPVCSALFPIYIYMNHCTQKISYLTSRQISLHLSFLHSLTLFLVQVVDFTVCVQTFARFIFFKNDDLCTLKWGDGWDTLTTWSDKF